MWLKMGSLHLSEGRPAAQTGEERPQPLANTALATGRHLGAGGWASPHAFCLAFFITASYMDAFL